MIEFIHNLDSYGLFLSHIDFVSLMNICEGSPSVLERGLDRRQKKVGQLAEDATLVQLIVYLALFIFGLSLQMRL